MDLNATSLFQNIPSHLNQLNSQNSHNSNAQFCLNYRYCSNDLSSIPSQSVPHHHPLFNPNHSQFHSHIIHHHNHRQQSQFFQMPQVSTFAKPINPIISSQPSLPINSPNFINFKRKLYLPIISSPSTSSSFSSGKCSSNFLIDSILSDCETIKNENQLVANKVVRQQQPTSEDDEGNVCDNKDMIYNWLQCTRYKPPKINRRSNAQPKRKPLNRGPRIPFSACQLEELEKKFKDIHYLSSMEVTALAENLNLGESRIRIWFQNRRARQKREERDKMTTQEIKIKSDLENEMNDREIEPVVTYGHTGACQLNGKESQ